MKFERLLIVDRILGRFFCLLYLLISKLARKRTSTIVSKVLVTKFRGIGDVVLALPMLKLLSSKGITVIFLGGGKNEHVVRFQKFISKIYSLPVESIKFIFLLIPVIYRLRKEKIDACVDLTHVAHFSALINNLVGAPLVIGFENKNKVIKTKNMMYTNLITFNPNQHIVLSYIDLLRPLGILKPDSHPTLERLLYSEADEEVGKRILQDIFSEGHSLAGVHLSGPLISKRYPEEKWAEIIKYLLAKKIRIIAIGTETESPAIEKVRSLVKIGDNKFINCAGKLTLTQLFALMSKLDFFIANDGGPLHMAAAMGLPTLGIYGPETPVKYGPYNTRSYSVYKGQLLNCSPCSQPFHGHLPRCEDPKCLKIIKPEEVMSYIDRMLKNMAGFGENIG